ncbi:oxidoreductase-like protein [Trypanosoma grayi]|uniref:oxidoreductase-like protein n=1 Tax=Trypanosoma grayi TaxID=71804 RepID=UPI0004F4649C|nr:oxidoreductase-like protein [Trypanosoma grayi]KEG09017.1 oxidoreductase-like protein [Trypanosoma grayi]
MAETMTPINVGLLGAANIARLVWASIHRVGHRVTLVGCRDNDRGVEFVREVCDALSIPEATRPRVTTYDEVVASPDVDLVYMPIPVTARDDWVVECVANSKHVVGETPPAATAERLRSWIEALDEKELLYMDGTVDSHGKRVQEVAAAAKTLGPIKHMHSNHCRNAPPELLGDDVRTDPALEPHGALGDMGWCSIRYFLHVMELRMPVEVTGRIIKTDGGKDAIVQFSGELTFDVDGNKTVASLFAALNSMDEGTLTVAGTEAVLRMKDMCHPISGRPASWTITRERTVPRECNWDVVREVETFHTDEHTETRRDKMWEDVGHILCRNGAGRLVASEEQRRYWSMLSWKTQVVMDRMLESARCSG